MPPSLLVSECHVYVCVFLSVIPSLTINPECHPALYLIPMDDYHVNTMDSITSLMSSLSG